MTLLVSVIGFHGLRAFSYQVHIRKTEYSCRFLRDEGFVSAEGSLGRCAFFELVLHVRAFVVRELATPL
jgi:hypothetical protein